MSVKLDELETLLRQKESKEVAIIGAAPVTSAQVTQVAPSMTPSNNVPQKQLNTYSSKGSLTARNLSNSPKQDPFTSVQSTENNVPTSSIPFGLDVMWPNWPLNLPGPELLRHL